MLSRIRGRIEKVTENRLELRAGAFCYEILLPGYLEEPLRRRTGEDVELCLYHFLEGGLAGTPLLPRLIGFLDEAEREFYFHLLRLPGMGPKSLLKLLAVPPREIARAIETGDRSALSLLPGVGRKTAEKIIAELKGKVSGFAFEAGEAPPPPGEWGEAEEEAAQVLTQLAYKPAEAEQLIRRTKQKHPELATAEAIVQAVLKIVGTEARR